MRWEYRLGTTLFCFIAGLIYIVISLFSETFVMIGTIVIMSPVMIFTGIILFKMWRRKTTVIRELYKEEKGDFYETK